MLHTNYYDFHAEWIVSSQQKYYDTIVYIYPFLLNKSIFLGLLLNRPYLSPFWLIIKVILTQAKVSWRLFISGKRYKPWIWEFRFWFIWPCVNWFLWLDADFEFSLNFSNSNQHKRLWLTISYVLIFTRLGILFV